MWWRGEGNPRYSTRLTCLEAATPFFPPQTSLRLQTVGRPLSSWPLSVHYTPCGCTHVVSAQHLGPRHFEHTHRHTQAQELFLRIRSLLDTWADGVHPAMVHLLAISPRQSGSDSGPPVAIFLAQHVAESAQAGCGDTGTTRTATASARVASSSAVHGRVGVLRTTTAEG